MDIGLIDLNNLSRLYTPCSEETLLDWVTAGFVIGPVEFVGGWLFIKRLPVWFIVGA